MKMNKKGGVLVTIFGVFAVLVISLTISNIATAAQKSDTVFKINAAQDLRLMVETLAGVPGDVEYVKYPHDLSKYSLILNKDRISLFTPGDSRSLWVIRTFSLPQGYDAFGTVEEKKDVCLEKKGTKILLRPCEENES